MRYISILIFIFSFVYSSSQTTINVSLKKELDSIYKLHQMFISFTYDMEEGSKKTDSLMNVYNFKNPEQLGVYLLKLQRSYDSSNIRRIKEIFKQYGYPGKTMVGSPADEVAFNVLRRYLNTHEKEFPDYLPMLKTAADTKELPFKLYAEAADKNLMMQGKEQVYGTQITAISITASSGIRALKWMVWPIKDAATVNERRKAIGINKTVEQIAKEQNFIYQVYTLKDIKKMSGK